MRNVAILVLLFVSAPAAVMAKKSDNPWAEGVSAKAQKKALELFKAGNRQFEEQRFTEALGFYEKALAQWDHPSIRFAMAQCYINLKQPLEAWEHLEAALKYGQGPHSDKHYAEALNYRTILENTIARVTISCEQEGVEVVLDGKTLFTAPGKAEKVLHPGEHRLMASKEGWLTLDKKLELPPGQTSSESIELVELEEGMSPTGEKVTYKRRWKGWIPWTVAGTGLGVGLIGVAVYAMGVSQMNDYDETLRRECGGPCSPTILATYAGEKSAAELKGDVGVALWFVGGAAIGAGVVMLLMNDPKRIVEKAESEPGEVTPVVTITPGYAGVGLTVGF
jgi:hypothetical protein